MARQTRGSNLGNGYVGKGGISADHPKMADMGRGKVGTKHMMPGGKMMPDSEMDETMKGKKSAHIGGKFAKKGKYPKGTK